MIKHQFTGNMGTRSQIDVLFKVMEYHGDGGEPAQIMQEIVLGRSQSGLQMIRSEFERDSLSSTVALSEAVRLAVTNTLSALAGGSSSGIKNRGDVSHKGNFKPTWGSARGLLTGDPDLLDIRRPQAGSDVTIILLGSQADGPIGSVPTAIEGDDPFGDVRALDSFLSAQRSTGAPDLKQPTGGQ